MVIKEGIREEVTIFSSDSGPTLSKLLWWTLKLFSSVILPLVVLSCTALAADPPVTRYEVGNAKANIASFRDAVLAMMKLDCKAGQTAPACEQAAGGVKANANLSGLGWWYQASIHGSLTGEMTRDAWNRCEHSSWFFLPWHRMELYFFERVLRKVAKDNTLALSYWDFSSNPKLPDDFRMQMIKGSPNALWWPFRNTKLNTDNQPLCSSVVSASKAFKQTAFFTNIYAVGGMSFGGGAITRIPAAGPPVIHGPGGAGGGQIERAPHDLIHLSVGDGTAKSMSRVAGSGLDPVFWPIHVNIDRAWACWQQKHPGSEPVSDAWLNAAKFTFIDVQDADPGYKTVVMTAKQVIDTANQLGYVYDKPCTGFLPAADLTLPVSGAPQLSPADQTLSVLSATSEFHGILADEPVTVAVPLTTEIQERVAAIVRAGSDAPAGSILLTITGRAVDHEVGAGYKMYLNLPDRERPDPNGIHYADSLSFFGIGHHMASGMSALVDPAPLNHSHNAMPDLLNEFIYNNSGISYDITEVVGQLVANQKWDKDSLAVTFTTKSLDATPCVGPPPATPDARARFSYITFSVVR